MRSTSVFIASLAGWAAADIVLGPAGPVTWASPINVIASPGALEKDATASSGWNAGAISTQQFTSSTQPQGVSFKFTSGSSSMVGLTNSNAAERQAGGTEGYGHLAFAVDGDADGNLNVYEGGTHVPMNVYTKFTASDEIKVQVTGTVVTYLKNDNVFYTSATAATFPLHVDTALHNAGATISDVTVYATPPVVLVQSTPVTWASPINVVASPGALERSTGSGSWDAGAISTQQFTSSTQPQGVSFKCGDGSMAMIGLDNGNSDHFSGGGIAFAIYCTSASGKLQLYESGDYKGDFGTYMPTDVLEVQVTGTVVTYLKNDAVLYTSTTAPTFPLHVDTAINGAESKFSDVTVYVTPPCTSMAVTWTDVIGVDASAGAVEKATGTSSSWTAGAVSSQRLAASALTQSVSWKCGFSRTKAVGLSATKAGLGHGWPCNDIAFGWECGDGDSQIYESGVTPSGVPNLSGANGYTADDVFKIQVTGTTVEYCRNDVVVYTSATAATYPLMVDTSFRDVGAAITEVAICSTPPPTPPPTAAPTAAPTMPPPAPACTDTPASTAASASKITLERAAGNPVKLELLADGVVRFTDATCLEATLCNTCGIGGGSSAMASDIADMKAQIAALTSSTSAMATDIAALTNSTSAVESALEATMNMQCGGGICKTPVTWRRGTNDGNADMDTPGQLSKKPAHDQRLWDTGAASTADLTQRTGPQGVEFRCSRGSGTHTKVGLSHGGKEISSRDHILLIDFAVYCAGHLEISEGGVDHVAGEWTPDDLFKVRQSASARAGRWGGGHGVGGHGSSTHTHHPPVRTHTHQYRVP
jgi:acyl dehydratase